MQNSAKVGLLVIVFAALLYGGYAILGKAFSHPKTHRFYAEFTDAGGTGDGTPITMAGVRIGTVKGVKLISPRLARLTLEVDEAVRIPRGSVAKQGTSIIGLGSNPLQIVAPENSNGFLEDGETIHGGTSSPFEAYMPPEARETLKELNLTLRATRQLVGNKDLQARLTKLLDHSSATLDKFGAIAQQAQGMMARANGLIGSTRPLVAQAMRDASLAMSDIRKSTQLVTRLIESGKYQDQALALLQQLNETAKKADSLMANISNFVGDQGLQGSLKTSLANVEKMSDSGTRIAANGEVISKNGITLSEKAIVLADKASAIADEARNALEKISGFFGRGPSRPSIPKLEGHLDLLRQTDPNHWRTDLYGRVDLKDSFLDIGLYDAFESNKTILQLGSPLVKKGDYRLGIYASKPSAGVDFQIAPRVSLRGDVFDINKPHFDLRTQLDFGNGVVGWLGLEKIFDRNAFVAGVGIRK